MGLVETLDLRMIVEFAWRCETCSVAPTIPEGMTTMPELWRHLSGEGWTREGHLYRCPRHPISTRLLKSFNEDDWDEVYRV